MKRTAPSTLTRPRVYCASPLHRAAMWQGNLIPALYGGRINVVSTWHDNPTLQTDDVVTVECRKYWEKDFAEIRQADHVLAYAELKDKPNGTLIEIGYALAHDTPVALVGNFSWGTWRHLSLVTHYTTFREAIAAITGDPSEGEPNDIET